MDFLKKLKETLFSVGPIVAIVTALHFTVAPLESGISVFLLSSAILMIGLAVFLTGTDIGMVSVGESIGSAMTRKRNLAFMLITGFLIGFSVTIAEPDVMVLANQVTNSNPDINPRTLAVIISFGVGLFIDIGLLRVVLKINLKALFAISYVVLFIVAAFTDSSLLTAAFDAGGATTGPLAVPFIIAIGLGVSSASQDGKDNSFGLTGTASIGPIMAVAVMGLFIKGGNAQSASEHASHGLWSIIVANTKNIAIGLSPLLAIIVFFQIALLRLPRVRLRKVIVGIALSFIGIVLFLSGADWGFMEAGKNIGAAIASLDQNWLLIILGAVLGAIVVCAEPAVWVLTRQVEEVSGGHVHHTLVMIFLSIGVAAAVSLSMLRVMTGISYWCFIIPGYILSLLLMIWCPTLFTGIAFDSGGVASGPLSTTFVLSLATGASIALRGNPVADAFGIVGLIAMMPLIALQVLGIIYAKKEKKGKEENKGKKGKKHSVNKTAMPEEAGNV